MTQIKYLNPITGNNNFSIKDQPGAINSVIGMRMHPVQHVEKYHSGVDFKTKITPNSNGQVPVYSMSDGEVVRIEYVPSGVGKLVAIQHKNGEVATYFHLSKNQILGIGDTVKAGQQIGVAGNTGIGDGPHLHVGIVKPEYANDLISAQGTGKLGIFATDKKAWDSTFDDQIRQPLSLPIDSQGFLLDSHGNRLLLADSGQIATDGYYTTDKNSTTNNSNSTNPLDSANNQLTNPLGDNTNSTNDNQSQSDQEKTQDQIIKDALASEDAKQTATFMGELQSQLPSMMGIMAARLAMGEDIKLVSADMASRLIATSAINTYAENHWASNGFFALKKREQFIVAGKSQQKQPKRLFLTINEHQPKVDLFSKKRQQGACDAVAGTSRLQAKRRKAAKCVDANSDYFLLNLKTQNQMFANDNFEMVKVNKITGGYYV